jgi:pimeloyl-ACP methyl ester carboxylesterase
VPSGTTHTVFRGGTGEPLVLIHGFSGSRRLWDPLLAELERSFDVFAVSLAGHVDGPAFGAAPICVPSLVDAVERDLDAAGFETAHLVGNSLGGWIALELAIRGRARSVVALSPAGGWQAGTPDERRLHALFTRVHRMSKASLPWVDTIMRRPRLRRQALREIVAHGERVPPAAAAQIVRDSLGCSVYFELMDAIMRDGPIRTLGGVECPVLVAWGTRDRILPAERYSRRFREMLPDAEWVALPGAGHVPMSDDPELIVRMIDRFAGGVREPVTATT